MKKGWTGLESAGKSQLMAVYSQKVLRKYNKWIKRREKLGLPFEQPTMAFDTPMGVDYIKRIEARGVKYLFFRDLNEVPKRSCSIFINEINKFFAQRGTEPLNRDQAEFLSQGAKNGVHIYFCSQDFSQAHKQFRFLVNEIDYVVKILGSSRPEPASPPINWIWGVVLIWKLDPRSFQGDNMSMEAKGLNRVFPSFYWINKEDTELYDTSYLVEGGSPPPVKLVEQENWYLDEKGTIVKKLKKWIRK